MCHRARMARGMVHPAVPSTFTFGDFQIDPAAGELRKRGRKLRIPQQPVQMLAMLVAAAGEIVTREQLRDALWTRDTHVDFDRGINKGITRLRQSSVTRRNVRGSSKPYQGAVAGLSPPSPDRRWQGELSAPRRARRC